MKFLNALLLYSPNDIEVHLMAAKVFMRKGKLLLALKSLLKCHNLSVVDRHHGPELMHLTVSFINLVECAAEKLNVDSSAIEAIKSELTKRSNFIVDAGNYTYICAYIHLKFII